MQEIKDLVRPIHDLGQSGMIEAGKLQKIKDLIRSIYGLDAGVDNSKFLSYIYFDLFIF